MNKNILMLLVILTAAFAGCNSDPDGGTISEPVGVTSFYFSSADNPNLDASAVGVIGNGTITVNVPGDTDLTNLVPTIEYIGASSSLPSGTISDFTNPVNITITGFDGTVKVYAVVVYDGAVSGTPFYVANANLGIALNSYNRIILDDDCSVNWAVEAYDGFTNIISLSEENGFTAGKKFQVLVRAKKKGSPEVSRYNLDIYDETTVSEIDSVNPFTEISYGFKVFDAGIHTVSWTGTDTVNLRFLDESIPGASWDNTLIIDYVHFIEVPLDPKRIVSFSFLKADNPELLEDVQGTITGTDINVTVPYGTDLTGLKPSIIYHGKSISPPSGEVQDFTSGVDYTVTAEDGLTRTYTVHVTSALNSAKEIDSFVFELDNNLSNAPLQEGGNDITGIIAGNTITLRVPYMTDLSALVPTIDITRSAGATIYPPSGEPQDFRYPETYPVVYTVTAEDGSWKEYTVEVVETADSLKEITSFKFSPLSGRNPDREYTGVISGTDISVSVAYGTDLTLTPDIEFTGSSIWPANGTTQDFTSPVEYTVYAAGGSYEVYTVTVTPNPAPGIVSFKFYEDENSVLADICECPAEDCGEPSDDNYGRSYLEGKLVGTYIIVTIPAVIDRTGLKPAIVPTKDNSDIPEIDSNVTFTKPTSDGRYNFDPSAEPVSFTVSNRDGSSKLFTVTVDIASQVPSASLWMTGVSDTSLTLNWEAATDDYTPQAELEYRVVYSLTGNIGTVADVNDSIVAGEANYLGDWVAGSTSMVINGLPGKPATYYYNILVRDSQGSISIYTMLNPSVIASLTSKNPSLHASGGVFNFTGFNITADESDGSITNGIYCLGNNAGTVEVMAAIRDNSGSITVSTVSIDVVEMSGKRITASGSI